MSIAVNLVFEDAISEFVMLKLLDSFEGKFYHLYSYSGNGFGYIKANINGFNQASVSTTFFVLTDLDNHGCPVALIREWLNNVPEPNFIFRIAIREVEAWLLADKEGFAKYTGVALSNVPNDPEREEDPKRTLIEITKRSRKRYIREDIVPVNQNAKIGPNYNERLMEFVIGHWDLTRAMQNSESLRRAYAHLDRFTYVMPK